jgi:uncharacterized protein YbbK (DUF523 family)
MTDGSPTSRRRPRVGVSSCLLGEEVRYDGGHKRSEAVVDELSSRCDWIPVCPELEIGLGVPRDPLHLAGDVDGPTMIVTRTGEDLTARMKQFAAHRIDALLAERIAGYVLKSKSPSCGLGTVPIGARNDPDAPRGSGLFAAALRERAPLLPLIEEIGLTDATQRESFTRKVLAYDEWRRLVGPPPDDDYESRVGDVVGESPRDRRQLLELESRLATDRDAWNAIEQRLLTSR